MERIVRDLQRARTPAACMEAAARLRAELRRASPSASVLNYLYARIYELLNSPDTNNKLSGIAAITQLTDEPVPDNETKIARMANYLRVVPSTCSDPTVLQAAAKALGHLACTGGTMAPDFVEYEARRALEWLQAVEPAGGSSAAAAARTESRRLAAVLILRELADSVPTLFYPHVGTFLSHAWTPLSDPRVHVREAAARALHSVLALVAARRSKNREAWYAGLYRAARSTLSAAAAATSSSSSSSRAPFAVGGGTLVDAVHGALLTLTELLQAAGPFMSGARFNETCELVLKFRDSRDRLVRRSVVAMLPRLAFYSPEAFSRSHAETALAHLLAAIRDPKQVAERGASYLAVGRIALAVGPALASGPSLRPTSILDRVMAVVREGLTPAVLGGGTLGVTARKTRPFVPEALTCVAMLARAVGAPLLDHLFDLIDPMFRDGLSSLLVEALQAVAHGVPALKPFLQERLLHEVSLILANRPFVPAHADPCPPLPPSHPSGLPPALLDTLGGAGRSTEARLLAAAGIAAPDALPSHGSSAAGVAASSGSSSGAPPLAALASMISSVPFGVLASAGSGGSLGGGPPGAVLGSGLGTGGAYGTGLPLTITTPTAMSWARNMPSASASGSGSADGVGGAGASALAAGLPLFHLAAGPGAMGGGGGLRSDGYFHTIVLAGARGVSPELVCLALRALRTFDLAGISLLPFLKEVLVLYLDDDDALIRAEASLTCAHFLSRPCEAEGAGSDPLLATAGAVEALGGGGDGEGGDGWGDADDDEDGGEDEDGSGASDGGEGDSDLDSDDDFLDEQLGIDVARIRFDDAAANAAAAVAAPGSSSVEEAAAGQTSPPPRSSRRAGNGSHRRDGVGALGLDAAYFAAGDGAFQRRDRQRAARKAVVAALRPPKHPLLVYGTDMLSVGIGMGDYTSPAALAVAGYRGGLAEAGLYLARRGVRFGGRVGGRGRTDAAAASMPLAAAASVLGAGPTLLIVSQTIQRLLLTAVTDPDPAVRFETLVALDASFDTALAEESNLRLLIQGLQDENFAVREAVLAVLGRLIAHNPGFILPALRRTLLALVAELEHARDADPDPTRRAGGPLLPGGLGSLFLGLGSAYGGGGFEDGPGSASLLDADADAHDGSDEASDSGTFLGGAMGAGSSSSARGAGAGLLGGGVDGAGLHDAFLAASASGGTREHAARMLGLLIRMSQRLVAPYVAVLLRCLLPNLWYAMSGEGAPGSPGQVDGLSTSVLAAIGELSAVGADRLLPYMSTLLPLVVEAVTQGARALGVTASGSGLMGRDAKASVGGGAAEGGEAGGVGAGGAGRGGGTEGGATPAGDAYALNDMEGGGGGGSGDGSGEGSSASAGRFGAGSGSGASGSAGSAASASSASVSSSAGAALPVVMSIQDPALFTEVAVRTLGLLVENTGHVVVPYIDHPHLLQVLLALLTRGTLGVLPTRGGYGSGGGLGTAQWSLRREVLRTVGILGALDPHRHRMAALAQLQRAATAVQAAMQARLAAAVADARARGRRIAAAGLDPSVLQLGVRPALPFAVYRSYVDSYDKGGEREGGGSGGAPGAGGAPGGGAGAGNALLAAGGLGGRGLETGWDLHSALPKMVGVAVGGGVDVDPLEAAVAGLGGESGAKIGVNLEEVGIGLGIGLGGGAGGLGGGDLGLDLLGLPGLEQWGPGGGLGGGIAGLLPGAGAGGQAGGEAGAGGAGADGLEAGAGAAGGGAGAAAGGAAGGLAAVAGLSPSAILPSMVASPEDYFPTVALRALLGVLGNDALAVHHNAAVAGVMLVLRALGPACVPFLPQVVPAFLAVLTTGVAKSRAALGLGPSSGTGGAGAAGGRGGSVAAAAGGALGADGAGGGLAPAGLAAPGAVGGAGAAGSAPGSGGRPDNATILRDTVLQQLAVLTLFVRHHMRPWLPAIHRVARQLWPASLPGLLRLIEATAAALGEEAKPYIALYVPCFLSVLAHDGARPPSGGSVGFGLPILGAATFAAAAGGSAGGAGPGGAGAGAGDATAGVGGLPGDGSGAGLGGGGASGGGAGGPSAVHAARLPTRHVLYTLSLLAGGGRRGMWGGHRHLLDDYLDVLVPAIARVIDAGLGVSGRGGGAGALLLGSGAGAGAGGGYDGTETESVRRGAPTGGAAPLRHLAAHGSPFGWWTSASGIPSNSSPLPTVGHVSPALRRQAIDTIASFAASGLPLAVFAARLIPPLARTLADLPPATPLDVKRAAVDTLCLLLLQMRDEYTVWVPTVRKACLLASLGIGLGKGLHGEGGAWAASDSASSYSGEGPAGRGGADLEAVLAGSAPGSLGTSAVSLVLGGGACGVSGTGPGSLVRHETYERLVSMLLGCGNGYGPVGDTAAALYGYGAPAPLPLNPVELATLLYDPGVCATDGSGIRVAAALSLADNGGVIDATAAPTASSSGAQATPAGSSAAVWSLDSFLVGGSAAPATPRGAGGLASIVGDNETFAFGLAALGANTLFDVSPALWRSVEATAAAAGSLSLTGGTGEGPSRKLPINQDALRRVWDPSGRLTKDDWTDWMRRLSTELLRESPSPALRACFPLAQVHPSLAESLFNAAFVAVWTDLYEEHQASLIRALEVAFTSETVPPSILKALLELAEFMEHDEKALPVDVRALGALAERVGAHAKALHYKEMEFQNSPSTCIEALISINNHLDQPEAAVGILKHVQQQALGLTQYGVRPAHVIPEDLAGWGATAAASGLPSAGAGLTTGADPVLAAAAAAVTTLPAFGATPAGSASASAGPAPPSPSSRPALVAGVDVQESWYEKLGRWEDALAAYERRQVEQPNRLALVLGRMRCLKALGEWQGLDALARDAWPRLEAYPEGRAAVAPLAARAAWALGHWDDMSAYVAYTNEHSQQGSFFRAVLALHRRSFDAAALFIDRSRKLLAADLSSTGGSEPYHRLYRRMVTVQQLTEMEEILTYHRLVAAGNAPASHTYLDHIRHTWEARLRGCAKNVDVWSRLLSVRALVTLPEQNMGDWLQFASLCRRSGRLNLSFKVLLGLGIDAEAGRGGVGATSTGAPGRLVRAVHPGSGGVSWTRPAHRGTSSAGGTSATNASILARLPGLIDSYAPTAARLDGSSHEDGSSPGGGGWHASGPSTPTSTASSARSLASAHPRVVYAYLKYLWASGAHEEATEHMRRLARVLDVHVETSASGASSGSYGPHALTPEEERALRVRAHLRLGQWEQTRIEGVLAGLGSAAPAAVAASGAPGAGGESRAAPAAPAPGARGLAPDAYALLIAPVVTAFRIATHECEDVGFGHYRAWHGWSMVNFAAAEQYHELHRAEKEKDKAARAAAAAATGGVGQTASGGATGGPASGSFGTAAPLPPSYAPVIAQAVVAHAVAAVKGFFRSIALGRARLKAYVLQDLLRLITLWFAHGEAAPVRAALEAGLASGAVSMEIWLQVIPQLIARIHTTAHGPRKLLHALLGQVGAIHPHALVYPLTVATKSTLGSRKTAAAGIMGAIRRRWGTLVEQADVVSRELIRVAIMWFEQWHSGLEDASRLYFGEANIPGMLGTLLPLHEMLTNPGPQTVREAAFVHAFGADLSRAHALLVAYKSSQRTADISQAWDIYYHIFRKINKLVPTVMTLELHQASPTLLSAHDMELSVPGTYTVGLPTTRIMSFCPYVDILPSKQRPRKVTLLGSDGRQYTFLLKGHEDLRQDERVMQLFGLVNTLLSNDGETARRDLSIRRYAVTPLSHNVGVVGWVPNCDTLHALIEEYRKARKILLNIEHRLMVQMAPSLDFLSVLQKLEAFTYALDNTTGQDLYKLLWLKSSSSEVWLERRTAYTRSLAVMSIVGYVLGLGDRHPSNLMLDRLSGKILHIDFGDCFETAMTREKVPERVPFRLTRMLVLAMEVSGIEGNYRSTSEATMRVLREHRDSVMAMLEAFVHDPLINWRLLTAAPGAEGGAGGAGGAAAGGAGGAGGASGSASGGGAGGAPAAVPAGGASGAPTNGVVAGALRLAEADPSAAALVAQGLAFAAESEAAALAAAAAEAGLSREEVMAAAGGGRGAAAAAGAAGAANTPEAALAAATNAALARSIAQSVRGRSGLGGLGAAAAAAAAAGAGGGAEEGATDVLNERAVAVVRRIAAKLTGRDFADDDPIGRLMGLGIGQGVVTGTLPVPAQVQRLIAAATSLENLSQLYVGWCPFW